MRKNLIFALLWCLSMSPLATMAQEDDGATASESTTKTYTLGNASASLVGSGEVSLTFTGQYGEFVLTDKVSDGGTIDPAEYSGMRILCSDLSNYSGDSSKPDVKVWVKYANGDNDTDYDTISDGAETNITFKTDCGNITDVAIYADNGTADDDGVVASLILHEAYLIKASSEEEVTIPTSSSYSWNNNNNVPDVTTESDGSTSTTFTFTQTYGQYALAEDIDITEYSGCRIVCSESPEHMQLKVVYNNDENGAKYPLQFSSGDNNYTFETELGNVTYIAIQSTNEWTNTDSSPTVSGVYLIKAPSEEEAVYPGTETYNCTPTYASDVTAVKFNSQWNAVYLMDGEDYATFKQGEGKTVYYTITFAEPIPSTLYYELDYLDDDSQFQSLKGAQIEAGSTSYTFSISDSDVNQSVDGIKIEANAANDSDSNDDGTNDCYANPFIVKFASVYSTEDYAEATFNLGTLGTASFNSTYDPTTRTITYSGQYGGCGWWFGGHDLSVYQGVEVAFKTETTDYIQLVVEYLNENGTKTDTLSVSANTTGWGNMTDGRTLYVDFNGDFAKNVLQIYIQNGTTEDAQIKVVGARLLEKAVEGEPYTYEMNLAGYALTNWEKSSSDEDDTTAPLAGGSGTIEVDDAAGTAKLFFTEEFGGLGWKNWSEAVTNVGKWNLAQFDRVEITYEAEGMDEWEDETYIELFTQLNDYDTGELKNITAENTGEKGTIVLPISGGTYSDADGETVDGDEIDWTGCGQLVILASKANMKVTVTSIKFIRDKRDVETENSTYDLSEKDAVMPKVGYSGVELHVKGDGTTNHHTITFPLNSSGTYNIYLEDVTIDTRQTDALISGLTIPRGVTVNLYVAKSESGTGVSNISGSTYGIRAALGSTLNIIMKNEEESKLNITADDFGIYFLGTQFTLYGDGAYSTESTENLYDTKTQTTINATYCGMYFGNATTWIEVKGTNLTINVDGNSDEVPEAIADVLPAACGIYNGAGGIALYLSVGIFDISATGSGSYGVYSAYKTEKAIYVGWCTFMVAATECVLHKVDGDNQKYVNGLITDGSETILSLRGPFCAHYDYTQEWDSSADDYGMDYYWHCDGSSSGNFLNSSTNYKLVVFDEDAPTYGYNLVTTASSNVYNAPEIMYVDRELSTGWNVLCLPYAYSIDKNDATNVDETLYTNCKEARDVIGDYATFTSWREDEEVNDSVLVFTSIDETETTLKADKAYLVYVDPESEDVDENGVVMVKFTAKNTPLDFMEDDYSEDGDPLKTIYHPEKLVGGTIVNADGEEVVSNAYKLIRRVDDEGNVKNYFNQALTSVPIYAYRAYISGDELGMEEGSEVSVKIMNGEENTPTAIENIDNDTDGNAPAGIYNMGGQLIGETPEPNVTRGLPKGIYIINGKKMIVK